MSDQRGEGQAPDEPARPIPTWPTMGEPSAGWWPGAEPPAAAVTAPDHAPSPSRRGPLVALGAGLLALILLAGTLGFLIGDHGGSSAQPPRNGVFPFPFGASGSFGRLPGRPTSVTVPSAVARSERALVDIDTTIQSGYASGAGTGIVLTASGIVLTNNHVIDGASSVSVTDLGNGRTYQATVLGYDVRGDVAVLKLAGASGLATASIGSPAVSQAVYAVGNAGGTGGTPTVTSGTITATGQSLTASDSFDGSSETLSGMLETSATLISGDSGGALTTKQGEVVGMDTAASSTSSTTTQGYAIPIATALSIAHLITGGTSSTDVHVGPTALLGVQIQPAQSTSGGALVTSVASGTAAATAGITVGSRVTMVGGLDVPSSAGLRLVMASLRAGSTVTVTWVDTHGAHHSARVVLSTGAPQ
jgi:S1-C subfamily serine protease